jgi:transcription factor TFIIIB component B''
MEIEENDFTRLTNSASYRSNSKIKGPNTWTEEETELFYRGLQMLGTDFQMISRMFPGKGRRHVKMKFNREERHAPARVNAALIGEKTLKIDLEEYQTWTKADYEPVDDIYAQQKAKQAEYDAEQSRLANEQEEINRKKREALFADGDGGRDGEGGDSKGRKRASAGTRRRKKQFVETNMLGEPVN